MTQDVVHGIQHTHLFAGTIHGSVVKQRNNLKSSHNFWYQRLVPVMFGFSFAFPRDLQDLFHSYRKVECSERSECCLGRGLECVKFGL